MFQHPSATRLRLEHTEELAVGSLHLPEFIAVAIDACPCPALREPRIPDACYQGFALYAAAA